MNKIKPCPFCGTKVGLSKIPLWQGCHGYINCFEVKIVCPKCGCNVTYDENDTIYRTEKEAIQNVIEAWNKRNESNTTATIEKIRAEIIDTGAYEQETKGKTQFLEGINYCLSVIDGCKESMDESNSTAQQQPCPVQPKTGRWKKMVSVYDVIKGTYTMVPYTHKDEELNNTPIYICDCGNISKKPTKYCSDCGIPMQVESEMTE